MKLKKIISFGVAAVMLSSTLVFTNAATSFMRGDINCDGKISISDLTALAKYLNGTQNYSADICDVNGDGVADANDGIYLTRKIGGNTPEDWSTYQTAKNVTADNSEKFEYIVIGFSPNGGSSVVDEYDITPAMLPGCSLVNDKPQTGSVLPDPALTVPKINEYTGNEIVEVIYVRDGVESRQAGFIIGPNKVVTTGTSVSYSYYKSGMIATDYSDSIFIRTRDNKKYPVSEAHIPLNFKTPAADNCNYALLKVNTTIDNITTNLETTYGKLSLGVITDDRIDILKSYLNKPNAPKHTAIVSYPKTGTTHEISFGNAFLPPSSNSDIVICTDSYIHRIDGGQYGGALLYDADGNWSSDSANDRVVVGIFVKNFNNPNYSFNVRITAQLMQFYLNNTNF